MKHKPFVVVISGPSGVGKTTVVRSLIRQLEGLWLSVSATSRPPRPGETPGKDYIFISEKDFSRLVKQGYFIEWNRVFNHYYGTPKQALDQHLAQGLDVILEIDVEGGLRVKQALGEDCVCVLIAPPSTEELLRRLSKRGTEQPEDLEARLNRVKKEMKMGQEYDYMVINDHLGTAIEDVACIIKTERCSLRRRR